MGGGGNEKIPLLRDHPEESDGGKRHIQRRTGTVWTAIAHIITAVIGSGVLSLSWSVAQLGWIVGPIAILFFAAVTVVQSILLCDCYRSPDSEHGHIRNQSYMDAVKLYLGDRSLWVCGLFQQVGLYGCGIAYTITASASARNKFQETEGYIIYLAFLCFYSRKQSTRSHNLAAFVWQSG